MTLNINKNKFKVNEKNTSFIVANDGRLHFSINLLCRIHIEGIVLEFLLNIKK